MMTTTTMCIYCRCVCWNGSVEWGVGGRGSMAVMHFFWVQSKSVPQGANLQLICRRKPLTAFPKPVQIAAWLFGVQVYPLNPDSQHSRFSAPLQGPARGLLAPTQTKGWLGARRMVEGGFGSGVLMRGESTRPEPCFCLIYSHSHHKLDRMPLPAKDTLMCKCDVTTKS